MKQYIRKVRRIGNSLAVTIPIQFIRELGWKAGDIVDIIPTQRGLLIRKHKG